MRKKTETEPPKKKVSPEDVLINAEFMTALALELMLRETERRMEMESACFQREAKQKFNRFIDHTKKALHFAEDLTQEIYNVDADVKWKNIQTWQDEANEVARLVLLWEDREPHPDECDKIFRFIRQNTEGDGVVDDRVLSNYYLQKSCPIDIPEVGDRIRSGRYGEGILEFNTIRDNWAVRLNSGEQVILSEKQFKLL